MDTPRIRRARRGVALPMAVLAVALLTSLIAGALLVLGSERRTIDTQDATVKAAALAQSALKWFEAERTSTYGFTSVPPAASESTRVTYAGVGYADVVLTQVRPEVGGSKALYLVRSHGVLTGGRLSGLPAAERTVAQYAEFVRQSLKVKGGWTALTGLTKNGSTGTLSGVDNCGDSATTAGVAVPTVPGYVQNGGGTSVPSGSPGILDLGTQSQTNASVQIDWDGIINHGAITPDITIPPGSLPPTPYAADYWPVILIDNTSVFDLGAGTAYQGQGLLIVRGDLNIDGASQWKGIVLVGGALTANGNNTVLGTVVSGLNAQLGMSVPPSDVGNGTKTYQYDSCNVASALAGLNRLVPFNNAWADNWASY